MKGIALSLWLAGQVSAQLPVSLHGTITDPSGKPVAGARIALESRGLSAVSDAQGRYQLVRNSTDLAGTGNTPVTLDAAWAGGALELRLGGDAMREVRIALHTLEGRRIGEAVGTFLSGGTYRINPFRAASPGRIYFLRIQAGDQVRALRAPYLAGPSGHGPITSLSEEAGRTGRISPFFKSSGTSDPFAPAYAAGDTLSTVAVGFQREDRGLPALEGVQDFKLKAVSYSDVPYKTGGGLSAYESERCRLDVHVPASAAGKKLPVVLHFHGGGLHGGDKNEGWFDGDNWFSRKLMEEGLILFSANYRLGQDPDLAKNPKHVVFPEYIRDAAAAVAWVRRNLESYGGDPASFFVSGYSAGAWLAAMLAVDSTYYKAVGFRPDNLNGYLCYSAQTYTYGQVAYERSISDRGITDGALLHYVRRLDIPMALFVGGNEGQRIPDMQTWLKRMQDAGSTRMSLSVQPGRDHKQLVTTMGNATDDTRARTMAFIRQYDGGIP